jgi:hypothetical protein
LAAGETKMNDPLPLFDAILGRRLAALHVRRLERRAGAVQRQAIEAVLDREIDRLPEPYKTVVIYRYLQGRSVRETSAYLGWSRRKVCTRLLRGRRLLLRRLSRLGPSVAVVRRYLNDEAQASRSAGLVHTAMRAVSRLMGWLPGPRGRDGTGGAP